MSADGADQDEAPVSISELRSRFEKLSSNGSNGDAGPSRLTPRTTNGVGRGGGRTESGQAAGSNSNEPPVTTLPSSGGSPPRSKPATIPLSFNSPPPPPLLSSRPKPVIVSTPASPLDQVDKSRPSSPIDGASALSASLKAARRAAPVPPPKLATSSNARPPSSATSPVGSESGDGPPASVKALRERFAAASPELPSKVVDGSRRVRAETSAAGPIKPTEMIRQLSAPAIKLPSTGDSTDDDELHLATDKNGESSTSGLVASGYRPPSRSISPIPPPQPNRASKPKRVPSPRPAAEPTSSAPVSVPTTPPQLDQTLSRSPSLISQSDLPSAPPIPPNRPAATSISDSNSYSPIPSGSATPPRLPSRSRAQTLTRSELFAPPPLPSRTAPVPTTPDPEILPQRSHTTVSPIISSSISSAPRRARAMPSEATSGYQPPPPPTRSVVPLPSGGSPPRPARSATIGQGDLSSEEEEEAGPAPVSTLNPIAKRAMDELPDTTHANKRAPTFTPDIHLLHPHQINSFAVFGRFVCTGAHHVRVYDTQMSDRPIFMVDLRDTGLDFRIKDPKVTAMCFRPTIESMDQGRYLVCGTKDGHLWNLDIMTGEVTDLKSWVHGAAIVHIFRYKNWMMTLDEMGKLYTYQVPSEGDDPSKIPPQIRTLRVAEKFTFARLLSGQLWTGGPPPTRSTTNASNSKGPTIRVYEPFADGAMPSGRTTYTSEWTGAVRSAATCPFHPNRVYLGHEGGFISLWSTEDLACLQVLKVSTTDILALEGVGGRLWFGNRKGQINVCNVSETPWQTTNIWTAHHDSPIYNLVFDPWSIEHSGRFTVFSTTRDAIRAWDGLLSVEWIDKQMTIRQPEYCTFRDINVLICTWNIDSAKPHELSGSEVNSGFLQSLLTSVQDPDIIVFGFQEVIPLTDKKLTAKNLLFGGKKEVGTTHDKVSLAYRAWLDKLTASVRLAHPEVQYVRVQSESLVGLFTCMFVKADQKEALRDVQITTVKRGIGGIYGNKGAIIARMVMDDTSLCFLNVHLAAGQSAKAARNVDLGSIMEEKAIFPVLEDGDEALAFQHGGDGTAVLDHEMVVLNGDLNYRIDQRRETVISSVLASDFASLIENDQLTKEMRYNRAFRLRSFTEPPITFAPTYKYNPHTNDYDSSDKKRIPAWCDRILFTSGPRIRSTSYQRYEPTVSDHRPVSAGLVMTLKRVDREKMRDVRKKIGAEWGKRETEMLGKMADVFAKLW